MKKSMLRVLALAGASALALAGCAEPPGQTTPTDPAAPSPTATDTAAPPAASDFKACMVSDAGGFDDKSFNETAYKGLTDAVAQLGIQKGEIESNAEDEFAGNVQAMIDAKCDLVITVGFALADATQAAAKQNPDVKFAIVDYGSFEGVDNAKGLLFNTAEPSFLAGYVAAAMTKTGTVGTFNTWTREYFAGLHAPLAPLYQRMLAHYQARYAGAMYSGCGGGYLFVVSEDEVPGALGVKVRIAQGSLP